MSPAYQKYFVSKFDGNLTEKVFSVIIWGHTGNAQPLTKRHESFSGKINKNVQKTGQLEISFFELFKVN